MTERTVGDVMTLGALTISADAGLHQAVRLMDEYRVRGLAVVDTDESLVGVISQSDLVRARVAADVWDSWRSLAVRYLMTTPAVTAPTSMTLSEAARLMEEKGIHRLVIVGHDGVTPVGIVSTSDVIRDMAGARR
ncbi:MAG: CBS domain-containing protein [Chloroflexota bacterium]